MEKKFKVEFEITLDRLGASSVRESFKEIFPHWRNIKVEEVTEPKQTIQTVQGEAKFIRTEFEDSMGHWNDSYSTKDGYYVIHDGNEHHVYKVTERSEQ